MRRKPAFALVAPGQRAAAHTERVAGRPPVHNETVDALAVAAHPLIIATGSGTFKLTAFFLPERASGRAPNDFFK